MTKPKLHLQAQLQGNSCKDELALTGPFVLRHHSLHTQIGLNTKMHARVETHTLTLISAVGTRSVANKEMGAGGHFI